MSKKNEPALTPVLQCLPFAVDTWSELSQSKHQFITHAHKDHLINIDKYGRNIICSSTTEQLVLNKFPQLRAHARFRTLEPGQTLHFDGTPDFTVTAIDANHCPGSCMFLFSSAAFGAILHTGDCRLTPAVIQSIQDVMVDVLGQSTLDVMYLDCTFGAEPQV